jgi:hypothetical protein
MAEDFTTTARRTIAERAGWICTICKSSTIFGLSDDESSNVGEGAHIKGVRKGSARYIDCQGKGSVENGFWACAKCHKIIDDDPARYTVEQLISLRASHETWIAQNRPDEVLAKRRGALLRLRGSDVWIKRDSQRAVPYRHGGYEPYNRVLNDVQSVEDSDDWVVVLVNMAVSPDPSDFIPLQDIALSKDFHNQKERIIIIWHDEN